MIRYLLLATLFAAVHAQAQSTLQFDKRFVESEDHWVAFQQDKDGSYPYGFIYIDEQAGLTLNYEGKFTILPNGAFEPKKLDSANIKVRLEANNVKVAFIPVEKFTELGITPFPEWLSAYKKDTGSVSRLFKWGYMYNGWEQCEKALGYLQRANDIDPNYKGLRVEIAFSYNCLGNYEKAAAVLADAIRLEPTDAYTNKELIYALIKSDQLDKASEACQKAMEVCKDKQYNGENCYNLLYTYYTKKDKDNFNHWVKQARKWNSKNEKLIASIESMDKSINQ